MLNKRTETKRDKQALSMSTISPYQKEKEKKKSTISAISTSMKQVGCFVHS